VVWFGGNDVFQNSQGITRYDRATGKWEYFVEGTDNNLRSARVNAIGASQNFVWFGTWDGLEIYNKKKESWRFYGRPKGLGNNYITCLEYYQNPDKKEDEILFIGTSGGLYFYRLKKDLMTRAKDQAISTEYINCLKFWHNYLWIGTRAGVYRISLPDGSRGEFSTADGITNSNINDIEDDKERIWFATDRGLLGYDPNTDEREVYQISGNYPGRRPLRLAIDGWNLWVGTQSGVWKMDKEEKTWENFTVFDGLIDDDIQSIALDGDYIWFGTPRGATRFYWKNVRFSK
jgi:ligand-binding sensor domain-containing protein